jgi:hypothetical protein
VTNVRSERATNATAAPVFVVQTAPAGAIKISAGAAVAHAGRRTARPDHIIAIATPPAAAATSDSTAPRDTVGNTTRRRNSQIAPASRTTVSASSVDCGSLVRAASPAHSQSSASTAEKTVATSARLHAADKNHARSHRPIRPPGTIQTTCDIQM